MVRILEADFDTTDRRFSRGDADAGRAKANASNARDRRNSAAANELPPIPPCADPGRRYDCGLDLLTFLTEYFPHSTGLSRYGQSQIDAIKRYENSILTGTWTANLLPRAFCKSSISENGILWAILYGYRNFVLFFGSSSALATTAIDSIKSELTCNDFLIADFPEACLPFIALENKSIRSFSQTYQGEPTGIGWQKNQLIFANIPGSLAAEAVISSHGLLSPPRGIRVKRATGEYGRPDYCVIDDPSSDASAKSSTMNSSRLSYIHNSISMLGNHSKPVGICVNASVVQPNDVADQIASSPSWQSVRSPFVVRFPEAFESLWLGPYADLLRKYDRNLPDGVNQAKARATAFYRLNKDDMDRGHELSWSNVPIAPDEISGLQHAMNVLISKGASCFYAELQCQPEKAKPITSNAITMNVTQKLSGLDRLVVPSGCRHLTFGIDVHQAVLYYSVIAVDDKFDGSVIDYGTYPRQNLAHFNLASAKQTLQAHYKTATPDEAIELGVRDLVQLIMSQRYVGEGGEILTPTLGGVDIGYKPTQVKMALQKLLPLSRCVFGCKGVPVNLQKKSFNDYDLSPKRVARFGPEPTDVHWLFPADKVYGGGVLWDVLVDVNHWKTTLASLLTNYGGLNLFSGADHFHFVEHLTAESSLLISGDGRSVEVWSHDTSKDNHYFDSTTMAVAIASMAGARAPGHAQKPVPAPVVPRPPMVVKQRPLDLGRGRSDLDGFFSRDDY